MTEGGCFLLRVGESSLAISLIILLKARSVNQEIGAVLAFADPDASITLKKAQTTHSLLGVAPCSENMSMYKPDALKNQQVFHYCSGRRHLI